MMLLMVAAHVCLCVRSCRFVGGNATPDSASFPRATLPFSCILSALVSVLVCHVCEGSERSFPCHVLQLPND
uniref:Secreted protein n=1 Tax=Ixodes ricinus TaxID=34613 RepID=A0A6B0U209_IXORI